VLAHLAAIGVDEVVRHPDRLAVEQVLGLDPGQLGAVAGGEIVRLRHDAEVDHAAVLCQRAARGDRNRQVDMLAVEGLGRLHEAGGAGGVEIEPLALRDGQRARIGAARHDDRDPDVVEAGDVGQTRDPHRARKNAKSRQRFRWRDCSMRSAQIRLGRGPVT
jgi:hypothetical protein